MATVTVRGEAVADVPPDRVRLVVAVPGEAATAAEALAPLADRSAAAGQALDAAGEMESAAHGSVLGLRSEPVTVAAAVEVRYALLPGPGT
jgi:uncharacterized protein YggE